LKYKHIYLDINEKYTDNVQMNPVEQHHMFRNVDRAEAERLLRSRSVYGPIFRKSSIPHHYAISIFSSAATGGIINHGLLELLPNGSVEIIDVRSNVGRNRRATYGVEQLYQIMRNYNPGAYAAAPAAPAAAAINNNENPKPFVHEPRSAAPRKSRRTRRRRSRRSNRRT
jgi:hypothetical protein